MPTEIATVLVGIALSFLITTGGTIIGVLWRRLLFQEERAYKSQKELVDALLKVAEAQNSTANAFNNIGNHISRIEQSVLDLDRTVTALREELIRGSK